MGNGELLENTFHQEVNFRGQKNGYYVTYQTDSTCPSLSDAGLIWKHGEKSAGRGLVVYCEQPGDSYEESPPPVTIRTKGPYTNDVNKIDDS